MNRTQYRFKPTLCLFFAGVLAPMPALAMQSDTTNILMLAISLASFSFFNLLLTGLFYFTGKYHSQRFAKLHTLISLLPAVLTLLVAFIYLTGSGAISMNIGVAMVSIALSLLPLYLATKAKAPRTHTALIIAIVALVLLLSAYFAAPVAIFAIACSHVALVSRGMLGVKLLSYATLIAGYGYLGFWAYQIALHS